MNEVDLAAGSQTAIGEYFELHHRGLTVLLTTRSFGLPFEDLCETFLESEWIIMKGIMAAVDHVDFGLFWLGCHTIYLFLGCLEQVLAVLVAYQLVSLRYDQVEFWRDQKLGCQVLDLGDLIS